MEICRGSTGSPSGISETSLWSNISLEIFAGRNASASEVDKTLIKAIASILNWILGGMLGKPMRFSILSCEVVAAKAASIPSHRAARNSSWCSPKAPLIRDFGSAKRTLYSLAIGIQLICSTLMSGGVTMTAKSNRPWISLATRSRAVATSRCSGGAFSSANS